MPTQYRCKNERRRILLRQITEQDGQPRLNGIDYIEVAADRQTLQVYFIHPLSTLSNADSGVSLQVDNLLITGGVQKETLGVESISVVSNLLRVRVDRTGDYSTYTLRLVQSSSQLLPPSGIDPQLVAVDFSFWVNEISELDCRPAEPSAEKASPSPAIDYLAKDYGSFRRLMLDRLAVTHPQWQERNPADVGIMLVELLAYGADHLSYYQDAVGTEAYLGTARRRISVRRHARMLDYFMHEGCNARAWVVLEILAKDEEPQEEGPKGEEARSHKSRFCEGLTLLGPDVEQNRSGVKCLSRTALPKGVFTDQEQFYLALSQGAQVFETLHDIVVYPSLNRVQFYTWGDEDCCLPKGAMQATLCDRNQNLCKYLKPNRVLIIEEVKGPESGDSRDANVLHRHAVRLTKVTAAIDPLTQASIVEVVWDREDALPFDVKISSIDPDGKTLTDISIVRGNVVLVDSGRSLSMPENLQKNPGWHDERPLPRLKEWPLTQQGLVQDRQNQPVVFDPERSATAAMTWQLRDVRPAITLWERTYPSATETGGSRWGIQPDLLNSNRFTRDFVAETEEDGRTYLRFGDGALGKQPQADIPLYASYRVGNGAQGNVGADTIVNLWIEAQNLPANINLSSAKAAIGKVYNPLPARGGTEPEPIEQVKLYAPQAFRTQKRAVTAADYAAMAQTYPGVQKALATRRWTGSWHTIFITVDRTNGQRIDPEFRQGLLNFLEDVRLAGHDIELEDPRFVPLDIAMTVNVNRDYFQSVIKKALLDIFSSRVLSDGTVGFFAPSRLTFGAPVYLSQIVATAVQVAGVESVNVTQFQRQNEASNQALEAGVIRFDQLEIAQLDNIPSAPQNGTIEFNLEGGR